MDAKICGLKYDEKLCLCSFRVCPTRKVYKGKTKNVTVENLVDTAVTK